MEKMEAVEAVVIAGAGLAGLASALGLHRGRHEVRCVKRNLLLQTLVKDLPQGTIRYSSKIVSVEDAGQLKLLHLADGSTIRTKVLIGCDGVNSVVARFLGLKAPSFSGRSSIRGFTEFPDDHHFKNEVLQIYGEGFRAGLRPCDQRSIYWYFTWTPAPQDKEMEVNATNMRQFVLSKLKLAKVPAEVVQVVEKSDTSGMISSQLRLRWPTELLLGNISKENVCVAGDALHPMTPDLGQGGCSALEDGVVLARCLGDALLEEHDGKSKDEHERIIRALARYAKERRWRSIDLIVTSYISGYIQESDGFIWSIVRDRCLSGTMAKWLLKKADFDCGEL